MSGKTRSSKKREAAVAVATPPRAVEHSDSDEAPEEISFTKGEEEALAVIAAETAARGLTAKKKRQRKSRDRKTTEATGEATDGGATAAAKEGEGGADATDEVKGASAPQSSLSSSRAVALPDEVLKAVKAAKEEAAVATAVAQAAAAAAAAAAAGKDARTRVAQRKRKRKTFGNIELVVLSEESLGDPMARPPAAGPAAAVAKFKARDFLGLQLAKKPRIPLMKMRSEKRKGPAWSFAKDRAGEKKGK
ncbi:unnamed protein product [Phaeothamnion confervicola]